MLLAVTKNANRLQLSIFICAGGLVSIINFVECWKNNLCLRAKIYIFFFCQRWNPSKRKGLALSLLQIFIYKYLSALSSTTFCGDENNSFTLWYTKMMYFSHILTKFYVTKLCIMLYCLWFPKNYVSITGLGKNIYLFPVLLNNSCNNSLLS